MKRPTVAAPVKRAAVMPTRKGFLSRFKLFGEIYAELRKVIWPTREEAIRLTVMTLAVSAVVGVILGVLDFGFTNFMNYILSVGK